MAGVSFSGVCRVRRLALRWRRLLLLTGAALLLTATVTLRLPPLTPPLPALTPPLAGLLLPSPAPRHLLDLRRFRYLVNTDACGVGQPVTAVLLVHSNPRRPGARHAIRRSLPQALLTSLGVSRVFMLADASTKGGEEEAEGNAVTQEAIVEESRDHQDLVQGNFVDSYHNMTYKHVMALDWAVSFCPQARWLVKMDDDTLVDLFSLLEVLKTLPSRGFLGGNLHRKPKVYRDPDNKWSVPTSDWPEEFYPPYLSGGLYVVTQDVAQLLLEQSASQPFFWIDDVYVTGILAERAQCPRTGLNELYVTELRCAADVVSQEFRLTERSPHSVFAPAFIVSTTKQKNFTVLERFNELTHYCFSFACDHRERHKDCFNLFKGK